MNKENRRTDNNHGTQIKQREYNEIVGDYRFVVASATSMVKGKDRLP